MTKYLRIASPRLSRQSFRAVPHSLLSLSLCPPSYSATIVLPWSGAYIYTPIHLSIYIFFHSTGEKRLEALR